jgi:AcrR family transcriptional regulator
MPRINKDPDVRYNEILDAAYQLIYTKGYEQMTIQDILNNLQISKGAFYHYFDSKQALLEALIDRMVKAVVQMLTPMVNDPLLSPIDKFHQFFNSTAQWKNARKPFLLGLISVYYSDENALLRQKVNASSIDHLAPLLTSIIQEGIQTRVFSNQYPEQVGQTVMYYLLSFGEILIKMVFPTQPVQNSLEKMQNTVLAFTDTIERILGTKPGTFHLIDMEMLTEWMDLLGNSA